MNDCEVTIRGVYFKSHYGKYVESHGGTPGVELTVGGQRVFLDHREASLIAKTIERLGTSGKNTVTARAVQADTPAAT